MSISLESKKLVKRDASRKPSEKETRVARFARWLISRGQHLVTKKEAANWIAAQNPDMEVYEATVHSYIQAARKFLELHHAKSIWNEIGEGWRIATEQEKAIFLVRNVRNTFKAAERTQRLHSITDMKLVPAAAVIVFKTHPKAQEKISEWNEKSKDLFKYTARLTDGK